MKKTLGLLFLSSCSLIVKGAPLCGDGTADNNEVCYTRADQTAGTAPSFIVTANLDAAANSATTDLIALNAGAANDVNNDTATIFLSNGDGTFVIRTLIVGDNPSQAIVADLNGDLLLDLAVVNTGQPNAAGVFPPGQLLLFAGDDLGNFVPLGTPIALGAQAVGLAVSDLNGDLAQDLVVSNQQDQTLQPFLNNGVGVFTAGVNVATVNQPLGVVLADLNGDGIQDLAGAEVFDAVNAVAGKTIEVFPGVGDGTFDPLGVVSVDVGDGPQLIVAGDVNGDTKLDLAVTDGASNDVAVLIGDGALGFAAAVKVAVGVAPKGIVLADLDADGDQDLAVSNVTDNNVQLLINDAAGTFDGALFVPFPTGATPQFVATADLNNDAIIDLIAPSAAENKLNLLFSTP